MDNATTVKPCPIVASFRDQLLLNLFFLGPMALIGMFLNINNIIILRRQKHKSNSLFLLECLAYVDFAFLFCQFIRIPTRYIIAYAQVGDVIFRTDKFHLQPAIFYVMLPTTIALVFARNWTIILITLERVICLLAPFWARTHLTKRRLLYCVIGILIVTFSVGSVWWFGNGVLPANDPCAAPLTTRVWVKDDSPYIWDVDWYGFQLPAVYVPIFAILFLNILLLYIVIKSSRDRSKLTSDPNESSNHRQVTLMILSMAIIFIVCECPTSIDRLLVAMGLLKVEEITLFGNQVLAFIKMFGDILQVIDSSINFIAYCLTNRSFRRTFLQFWCRGKADDSSSQVSKSTSAGGSSVASSTNM